MSNLPASPASTGMSPAQRRALIAEKAQARMEHGDVPQGRSGSGVFLNFDGNTGDITYGRDKADFPEGQLLVAPLDMIKHGVRYWDGGKPTKDLMVAVLEGPAPSAPEGEPRVGDLKKPRHRDGWTDTIELTFVGIDGGDMDGIQMEISCSSMGAHGAAVDLINDAVKRARNGMLFDPILYFESDSYFNKSYDRDIHFPVFRIVEWTDGEVREPVVAGALEADDVLS